jgi:hypothetical protein
MEAEPMSEQEKRYYRVTHVVEITEYIQARTERICLILSKLIPAE